MEEHQNQRMDKERQMDEIFRTSLGNVGIEPPGSVWKNIRRRLLWKELARLNFTNISRVALIGGGGGIILLSVLIYFALQQEKVTPGQSTVNRKSPQVTANQSVPATHGKNIPRDLASVSPNPGKVNVSASPASENATRSSFAASHYNTPVTKSGSLAESTNAPASGTRVTTAMNVMSVHPSASRSSLSGLDILPLLEAQLFPVNSINNVVDPQRVTDIIRPIQPLAKPQKIPQHLAAGVSVAPEFTFYRTDHSYSMFDLYGDINLTYYFGKFYFRPGIGLGYYYDRSTGTVDFKSNDSIGYYYEVVSYTVHGNDIFYNTVQKAIYDSISHTHTEYLQNRYLCLQIPLILGVNAYESGRFRVGVQIGPVISFLIGKKEPVPDGVFPESRILRIQNTSKERVLTNWQIWAGLNFEYLIGKRISLSVSPEFRYFLNPVINNEVNQGYHPYSTGLNIGLSYHFAYKNQRP